MLRLWNLNKFIHRKLKYESKFTLVEEHIHYSYLLSLYYSSFTSFLHTYESNIFLPSLYGTKISRKAIFLFMGLYYEIIFKLQICLIWSRDTVQAHQTCDLLNSIIINLCCIKPLCLWQIVMVAVNNWYMCENHYHSLVISCCYHFKTATVHLISI